MRRSIRAALLCACLFVAAAPLAHAQPFSRMSFQGVLTDGLGNLVADGNYSFAFRIYDDAAAGNLLWTENHPVVAVTKGGFSVVLGSIDDLDIRFSFNRWLGVQVGADPELIPRVELTSAPASMSVAMRGDAGVLVGELNHIPASLGFGDGGGVLGLYSDDFNGIQHSFEPDFDGDGAWKFLKGASGGSGYWDGNSGGGGTLFINGPTSNSHFDTQASGNASVSFPGNAIASAEVLHEPGIAQGHVIGTVNVPAGGVTDGSHYLNSGFNPTADLFTWTPVSLRRVYEKPAGTYTFRLEGDATNAAGQLNYLWNPTITAAFYPTAYGTVTTSASGPELAQFSQVTRTVSGPNGPGGVSTEGALVDLRELELRVHRERERLAAAERTLQAAQLKQQQDASARFRAARRGGMPETPVAVPKEER